MQTAIKTMKSLFVKLRVPLELLQLPARINGQRNMIISLP